MKMAVVSTSADVKESERCANADAEKTRDRKVKVIVDQKRVWMVIQKKRSQYIEWRLGDRCDAMRTMEAGEVWNRCISRWNDYDDKPYWA